MNNNIPYSPSRLEFTNLFHEKLRKYFRGRNTILDIGCGKLFFYNLLKDNNIKTTYIGVDTHPLRIKSHKKKPKDEIVKKDFLKFNPKNKYDIATCLWVLEHIKNDEKALYKAQKLLSPKGILILAVPTVYSWPFEFGRHGYHYYSRTKIKHLVDKSDLEILKIYMLGGLLGFIFMIFYNWPRFGLLVPVYVIYRSLKIMKLTKKTWSEYSQVVIIKTLYAYHSSQKGIIIHNRIVNFIVKVDKLVPLFPASYIVILSKKSS